jgi:hypothetical protein
MEFDETDNISESPFCSPFNIDDFNFKTSLLLKGDSLRSKFIFKQLESNNLQFQPDRITDETF